MHANDKKSSHKPSYSDRRAAKNGRENVVPTEYDNAMRLLDELHGSCRRAEIRLDSVYSAWERCNRLVHTAPLYRAAIDVLPSKSIHRLPSFFTKEDQKPADPEFDHF